LIRGFNFDAQFLSRLTIAEECIKVARNRVQPRRSAVSARPTVGSREVRAFARALTGDIELAEDFLWRFYDDARLLLAGGRQSQPGDTDPRST
jgi:hypothetical protein